MSNEKYLITGRAGSGKSRICDELIHRGLPAEDGDKVEIEGRRLAGWYDLATRQKIQVDDLSAVDETKEDWLWDPKVLQEWLALPGQSFLCGSAGNDLEFFGKFAKVFVLSVDPFTHMTRLRDRPGNYVKDEAAIQKKLYEQQRFITEAIRLGAIAISTLQPPDKAVDQILARINED